MKHIPFMLYFGVRYPLVGMSEKNRLFRDGVRRVRGEPKMKLRLATGALALALLTTGGVRAAIVDLGNKSPLVFSNVSGLSSLTYSPIDADTLLVTDVGTSNFDNLFPNQSSSTLMAGLEMLIPSLKNVSFISGGSGVNAGTGTFGPTGGATFNIAMVHQGQAEFVFEYSSPISAITFGSGTPLAERNQFLLGIRHHTGPWRRA
jgi:hypothetical protein